MSDRAYPPGEEHVLEELGRIRSLVHAEAVRFREDVGVHTDLRLLGVPQVSESEADQILAAERPLVPAPPPAAEAHLARAREQAATIAERLAASEDVLLRLPRMAESLELSPLELDLLLACLLPEVSPRYQRLYGYLMDDASRGTPTIDLLERLLRPVSPSAFAVRRLLAGDGPLTRFALVDVESAIPGGGHAGRQVAIDARVADHLLGGSAPDQRVAPALLAAPAREPLGALPIERGLAERLRTLAGHLAALDGGFAVVLRGPEGSGRGAVAASISGVLGCPLLRVDAEAALERDPELTLLPRLVYREALLGGAAVMWSSCTAVLAAGGPRLPRERLISAAEGFTGPTFLCTEGAPQDDPRFARIPAFPIDLPPPRYATRRRMWERHLPAGDELVGETGGRVALAGELADAFALSEREVVEAVAAARTIALVRNPGEGLVTPTDLREACRRRTAPRSLRLATRIEPSAGRRLDRLQLPADKRIQLEELRDRIAHRDEVLTALGIEEDQHLGRGLVALFTGASGTGKTMAATALASELGRDLLKIDVAAVVSKWVGDTEKNIDEVFKNAGNSLVFFDEADSLFGRRGEVKEARDRWANLEVNFLLQRIEEHSGAVILATNLRQSIDEAFMRRIHVLVEFPFPASDVRLDLWRAALPAELSRLPDDALRELALRFPLSGGGIRNVVVDAAFRARRRIIEGEGEATTIWLKDLVVATARELQKGGNPVTIGEFGRQFAGWVQRDLGTQR